MIAVVRRAWPAWKVMRASFGRRVALRMAGRAVLRKLRERRGRRALEPSASGARKLVVGEDRVVHVERLVAGVEFDSTSLQRLSALLELAETLVASDTAVLTVIIPSFERPEELLACLESIALWPPRAAMHLLVVDDASTSFDPRGWNLPGCITVVRNPINVGYIRNVNRAALAVTSEFVMTLNQDTVVLPEAFDELLHCLEADPSLAIVGPLIVGTSWKINECGGAVRPGGEAAHRGRGASVDDPRWNFAQDADYVSGCALMTRSSLWAELGGLWDDLHPAYYDDSDLCLRAWEVGHRVRVVPAATVVHREGTSMGRDPDDEGSLKRFQNINRHKIAQRHAEILSLRASTPEPSLVVFIGDDIPRPHIDGGSVDFDLLLRYTAQLGARVRLITLRGNDDSSSAEYRRLGIGVAGGTEGSAAREWLTERDLLVTMGIIAGTFAAQHVADLPGRSPWVHFTGDVATRRLESALSVHQAKSLSWYQELPRDSSAMWRLESRILTLADEALFVSQQDLDFARDRGLREGVASIFPLLRGGPAPVMPAVPAVTPTVCFVGAMSHGPNPDAVDWLIESIWPRVVEAEPKALLRIWGSNIDASMWHRWSNIPGVEVRGAFADWSEVAEDCRALIAPLRFGAGVKGKVISAVQHGLPVIGTHHAFDGLAPTPHELALADNPSELAQLLLDVLISDEEWSRRYIACAGMIGQTFSQESEVERVRGLLMRHGVFLGAENFSGR
jgi:GT2 family glycosyltransferase